MSLHRETNSLFSAASSNTLPLYFSFTARRSVVLMRYQFAVRELNTSCREALRLRSREHNQHFSRVNQLSWFLLLFSQRRFFFLSQISSSAFQRDDGFVTDFLRTNYPCESLSLCKTKLNAFEVIHPFSCKWQERLRKKITQCSLTERKRGIQHTVFYENWKQHKSLWTVILRMVQLQHIHRA